MKISSLAVVLFGSLVAARSLGALPRQAADDACDNVLAFRAQSEPHGITSFIGFTVKSRVTNATATCGASTPGVDVIGNVTKGPCWGPFNATFSFTNYDDTMQGATLEYWLYVFPKGYENGVYNMEPQDIARTFANRGDPLSNFELYIGPSDFFVNSVAIA